jgi:predicted amidohydrolase
MTRIRVSAAAFKAGQIRSFDDFAQHVARLVDLAAAGTPDFLIFPELFTAELMNFFDEPDLPAKFARLTTYTNDYMNLFPSLAKDKGFYIIAGSHLKEVEGKFYNTSHIFTPDGQTWEQRKCHLFPIETAWTKPGDKLAVFETDKVKFSVLTCYDLEFPEAARLMTLQGADLLLSPSATLDHHGYWRVRHCGHARSIEDQVFVVHCSLMGLVAGLDFWGMSSILTPCDKGFPTKGIAAESIPGVECIVSADLDTEMLYEIRKRGAATTLKDRRWDLLDELYRFENSSSQGARLKCQS